MPREWRCTQCDNNTKRMPKMDTCTNRECDGVMTAHFTHADLVAVARFSVDETSSLSPQDTDAEAEDIVARMLGEKKAAKVEEPCAHAHVETNLPLMAWTCVDCGVVTETFLEVAKKAARS